MNALRWIATTLVAWCGLLSAAGDLASQSEQPGYVERASQIEQPGSFRRHTLTVATTPTEVHWLDLDGDRNSELVVANQSSVDVYAPLTGESERLDTLDWSGGAMFDLGDLDKDGKLEVVVVEDRGVRILAWSMADRRFVPNEKFALRVRRRYSPTRPMRVRMLDDVNDDGVLDLIYPAGARYRLFLGDGKGGFRAKGARTLPSGMRVSVQAPAGVLDAQLESSFRIPRLLVRDVDGDGRPDLIAQLERRLDVYRGQPEGKFDDRPAWVLDLARFDGGKEQPGYRVRVRFDAVNLTQEDLDGDGVKDFLVATGRKVWLFFAGEGFRGFDRPDRILQVSDDIAAIFTGDVDRDGRYDLVLVKFEMPGMTRLVAALLVGIELRIEALAYRNHGDRTISKKPDRINRISFDVPPILSLLSNLDDLESRANAARSNARRLRVGDFTGDGIPDIGLRSIGGRRLELYACEGAGGVAGGMASREMMDRVIRDLLFDADRNSWDLDRLIEYMGDLRYSLNRDQIDGRKPAATIDLRAQDGRTAFSFHQLTADKKAEVVVTFDNFRGRTFDIYEPR